MTGLFDVLYDYTKTSDRALHSHRYAPGDDNGIQTTIVFSSDKDSDMEMSWEDSKKLVDGKKGNPGSLNTGASEDPIMVISDSDTDSDDCLI